MTRNQILLTSRDGKEISIVQGDGTYGTKGVTCEVWISTEDDPVGYLTVEKLIEYLQEKC